MSVAMDRMQRGSWSFGRRIRLADARRARHRGDARRAIALYKSILLEEPSNIEVALRAAPLLAATGEDFDAWQNFRSAARMLARQKRYEECLAVYRDACHWVPHEFDAWRLRAELELMLGREEAAFETLIEGRTCFRGPRCRAQAIALLARARQLEPQDLDLLIDLASLYAESDQAEAALELTQILMPQLEGARLRQLRALEWRLTLSLPSLLHWLRALFASPAAVQPRSLELERLAEASRAE